MSRVGTEGVVGLGLQTDILTQATTLFYAPVIDSNFNPQKAVRATPTEVSGAPWQRSPYTASVGFSGNASFHLRANKWLDAFLEALHGIPTSATVSGTAVKRIYKPSVTSNNGALPFLTVAQDNGLSQDIGVGVRPMGFSLQVPAANLVTAQAEFFGRLPVFSNSSVATTAVVDTSPDMTSCNATLTLDGTTPTNISNIQIQVRAEMTNNENVVGSLYVQDISMLQRSLNFSFDAYFQTDALRNNVYRNGTTGSISSAVYQAAFELDLISAKNIPGNSVPYGVTFKIPSLDYMAAPISLKGGQLTMLQFQGQVTLNVSDATSVYSIEVISDFAQ